MKATELRIGNWVAMLRYDDEDNEIWDNVKISGINPNGDYSTQYWTENGEVEHYNQVEPIPLTPEILERVGFEISNAKTHYRILTFGKYNLLIHADNDITHPMDVALYSGGFYRQSFHHIKYVHQLQNLYFALTGEELNIEL